MNTKSKLFPALINGQAVGEVRVIERHRDSLLRIADVRTRTCLSRTTIYRRIAAGTFPASVPISDGLVAWYQSDIDAWVANPMGWRAAA